MLDPCGQLRGSIGVAPLPVREFRSFPAPRGRPGAARGVRSGSGHERTQSPPSRPPRRRVNAGIMGGEYKLIFVAPERFANDYFFRMLGDAGVGAFVIDEAHSP
jgi:hypothetical protein